MTEEKWRVCRAEHRVVLGRKAGNEYILHNVESRTVNKGFQVGVGQNGALG
jgi:hypothetical protein